MTWTANPGEIAAIALAEATKSNDPNTKVGAVLMYQKADGKYAVGARGYNHIVCNGDPLSYERPLKYDRVIHAEVMAIGLAAQAGVSTFRSILYVTHPPCKQCATLIRAAGVIAVIVGPGLYHSDSPENRAAAEFLLRETTAIFNHDSPVVIEF